MSNILTNNINPRSGNVINIGGVNDTVSIAGTVTYEDVTSVDSIGVVTARSGLNVVGGGITAVGVITSYSGIHVGAGVSAVGIITAQSGVEFGTVGSGVTISAVGTGTSLGFLVNGSERVRIDSSGRFGIGTIPSQLLHLSSAGFPTIRVTDADNSTYFDITNSDGDIILKADEGNTFANSAIRFMVDSSERARIDSSGRLLVGTSSFYQTYSLIQTEASGNSGISVSSTSLSNGTAAFYQVRGTVTALRYNELGIFKHAGIAEACGYLMQMSQNGVAHFTWVDNSNQYRISSNSNHVGTTSGTVIGTQTSDERIKNILGPVEYGLDILKQIEPVRYSLKSEPETEKLGFIAQQVLPLVPQSVFDTGEHIEGEPDDAPTKLGMEYVSLIPVLVNAIKELTTHIETLETRLTALEGN